MHEANSRSLFTEGLARAGSADSSTFGFLIASLLALHCLTSHSGHPVSLTVAEILSASGSAPWKTSQPLCSYLALFSFRAVALSGIMVMNGQVIPFNACVYAIDID